MDFNYKISRGVPIWCVVGTQIKIYTDVSKIILLHHITLIIGLRCDWVSSCYTRTKNKSIESTLRKALFKVKRVWDSTLQSSHHSLDIYPRESWRGSGESPKTESVRKRGVVYVCFRRSRPRHLSFYSIDVTSGTVYRVSRRPCRPQNGRYVWWTGIIKDSVPPLTSHFRFTRKG